MTQEVSTGISDTFVLGLYIEANINKFKWTRCIQSSNCIVAQLGGIKYRPLGTNTLFRTNLKVMENHKIAKIKHQYLSHYILNNFVHRERNISMYAKQFSHGIFILGWFKISIE